MGRGIGQISELMRINHDQNILYEEKYLKILRYLKHLFPKYTHMKVHNFYKSRFRYSFFLFCSPEAKGTYLMHISICIQNE